MDEETKKLADEIREDVRQAFKDAAEDGRRMDESAKVITSRVIPVTQQVRQAITDNLGKEVRRQRRSMQIDAFMAGIMLGGILMALLMLLFNSLWGNV